MPLKKLQEKCKKNRENKITLHSTKSIRTSLNNNKKQINSHQRKSNVPFYMITDAMISNFNFWIHVMLNSNISLGDLAVYNWCSRTFWSSIIYEHFTPPCEHIYCRLPYGLNLNQFSLFEYDCCLVIPSLYIILITENMHIEVIIFHYELHVPYALQFKYLYPFYVEFKS